MARASVLRREGPPCASHADDFGAEYRDAGTDGDRYDIELTPHRLPSTDHCHGTTGHVGALVVANEQGVAGFNRTVGRVSVWNPVVHIDLHGRPAT